MEAIITATNTKNREPIEERSITMRTLLSVLTCTIVAGPLLSATDEHSSMHGSGSGMNMSVRSMVGRQTTCPVSGKPIDPKVFTEYEGQKVHFCSKGCQERFKESPTQYLPALYKQIFPQRIQQTCPVMGEEIDPKVFADYNGQRVYFCCKECIAKFHDNPEKHLQKLTADLIEQVHCPISGEWIKRAVSTHHKGKKVYFCCKGCIGKYEANPTKYEVALRPTAGLLAYGESAGDDLILCPTHLAKGVITKRSDAKIVDYSGLNYALCNDKDATEFKADPGKYAKALREKMVKRIGADQAFTCSRHPDIVRNGPGTCPLCGMKLEAFKKSNW